MMDVRAWEGGSKLSVATLSLSRNVDGQLFTCLSIDPMAELDAPGIQRVRINVDTPDDSAVSLRAILGLLRQIQPRLIERGKLVAVFEDVAEGKIVFLPNPPHHDDVG